MEEQEIAKLLNSSVNETVDRHKTGYRAIYALLISWMDKDDPEIESEMKRLSDCLEQDFGASVGTYAIPSQDPQGELQKALNDFMGKHKFESKHSLFLLYYSGHGDRSVAEKRSIWTA